MGAKSELVEILVYQKRMQVQLNILFDDNFIVRFEKLCLRSESGEKRRDYYGIYKPTEGDIILDGKTTVLKFGQQLIQ